MRIDKIKAEVKAYLAAKDSTMTIVESFKNIVIVQHGDGSHFVLPNATAEQKKYGNTEMLLVWTEHCGYFYFFMEDLERWFILI